MQGSSEVGGRAAFEGCAHLLAQQQRDQFFHFYRYVIHIRAANRQ